jgi:hypothetical protein
LRRRIKKKFYNFDGRTLGQKEQGAHHGSQGIWIQPSPEAVLNILLSKQLLLKAVGKKIARKECRGTGQGILKEDVSLYHLPPV